MRASSGHGRRKGTIRVQIPSQRDIISAKYVISQEGANVKSMPRVKSSRNASSCLTPRPDGKSALMFSCSVLALPRLSRPPRRQLNRLSTVFDLTIPMNYSPAPSLRVRQGALTFSPVDGLLLDEACV